MTEFKLPELGENIRQGDLVRLMVSPGASVTEGQPVMELETDKAVVEVPSSVTVVVKDIRVKEGEKIKVGQVIFTVENGATVRNPLATQEGKPARKQQPAPVSAPEKAETRAAPQVRRRGPGAGIVLNSSRIQASGTRREHSPGRFGASDGFSRAPRSPKGSR